MFVNYQSKLREIILGLMYDVLFCSSHTDHVFDVAWSPTADFLVTASHDRLWKLWQPRVPSLRNSGFTSNNHQRYSSSQNDSFRTERTTMV